jgi:hypothetical protein
MEPLGREQAIILQRIVAADEGRGQRFSPMFIPSDAAPIAVAPYIVDPHHLLPAPIGRLAELGYLAVEAGGPDGAYGDFQVTAAGVEAAARIAAEQEDGAATAARRADERTVARLLAGLVGALEATTDDKQRVGLQRLRQAADGLDPTLLAGVVRDAAQPED